MNVDLKKSLKRLTINVIIVQIFALLSLVIAVIVMHSYMKQQIAQQMLLAAKNDFLTGDLREAILRMETANQNHFSAIGYFRNGEKVFDIPANLDPEIFASQLPLGAVWIGNFSLPIQFEYQGGELLGHLTFVYDKSEWLSYGFILWLLALVVTMPAWWRARKRHIIEYQKEIDFQEQRSKVYIASQLAHDIRSPLAALDVAVSQLGNLPEENRILIRRAVQRIHDIANDLLHKRKSSVAGSSGSAELISSASLEDKKSVQLLSGVLEASISEKRMQFRSRIGIEIEGQFDQDAYGIFATIQLTEFKRVLSNLINNSVEALGDSGLVFVKLHRQEKNAVIEISDNGKGIPPEILPKLMQQGETYGKKGGSGLGLYHARMSVEGWGGSVNLFSEVGKGTSVKVNLPLQEPPDWFVPELKIETGSAVVVIDDDDSIHEIWRQRFEPLVKKGEITLQHFSSPDEFENCFKNGLVGDLYLCDYEFLNYKKNGVDLIRELGINRKSILVTSRFEEDHVRRGCRDLGVRLIPKTLAGFVPITVQNSNSPQPSLYDAILLDDDDLVHMNWKMKAKIKRKQIKTYTHPDSLYGELKNISKDTPIYVDSSLSGNIKGEDVARTLSEEGFANLFLATGYDKSNFPPMPWLRDIVGKNPPWR